MYKSLSALENTFVYLIVLIFSINFFWIAAEELKFIQLSKNSLNYTASLLHRSILIPMILVIMLNMMHRAKTLLFVIAIAAGALGIILGLNLLALFFDVLEYTRWNLLYDALYIVSLQLAVFTLHKLFHKLVKAEALL